MFRGYRKFDCFGQLVAGQVSENLKNNSKKSHRTTATAAFILFLFQDIQWPSSTTLPARRCAASRYHLAITVTACGTMARIRDDRRNSQVSYISSNTHLYELVHINCIVAYHLVSIHKHTHSRNFHTPRIFHRHVQHNGKFCVFHLNYCLMKVLSGYTRCTCTCLPPLYLFLIATFVWEFQALGTNNGIQVFHQCL